MQRISHILLFLLSFGLSPAFSQQDIQFTQSMFDQIYFNPGVAGTERMACLNAIHRSQWVGLEGAPTTQNLNFHMPLAKLNGGIGLSIVNDQLGFEQNNEFKLSYAYNKVVGSGMLGIGISGGIATKGYRNPNWVTPDGSSSNLDDAIPNNGETALRPDVGIGVYYKTSNWFTGVSMSNTLQSTLNFETGQDYLSERHFYVLGGYLLEISRDIDIEPYAMIKTDISSFFQIDFAVRGIYDGKYWGGLALRSQDAVSILMGMKLSEKFKFGYSYDLSTSTLRKSNTGGHEIMLTYCFKIENKSNGNQKERYRNLRFL
ncbi:MAG: type IX secretion system PorP/SprF family membrane protein [Flavobacteriales bacterium]|jgi:type IX secretion system PorP/SprF family membrane protein